MQVHRYALFFPRLEGEEFAKLVEDVRAQGLLEPIVTCKGKILDGANRFRACKKAGVKPRFEKFDGNGALAYVISKNIHRRHLTADQRALIGIKTEKERAKKDAVSRMKTGKKAEPSAPKRWSGDVARAVGVSRTTVEAVDRAIRERPTAEREIMGCQRTARDIVKEVRAEKARRFAADVGAREKEKKRQKDSRRVARYLEAIKEFKRVAKDDGVLAAEFSEFSPEAQRFVRQRHDDIRAILTRIEEQLNG